MAKMTTHDGKHAIRAKSDDVGNIALLKSKEPCAECDAKGLDDDAFSPFGEASSLEDVLGILAELAQPDKKFLAFLDAVNSGDRAEALRLLREHDEETGEYQQDEEEGVVDAMMRGEDPPDPRAEGWDGAGAAA